jgi:hypothetical protein
MTLSVQCPNCKTKSPRLPPRTQAVVCQHCGHGCRLRVLSTSRCAGYRIQLAPLEPPEDKRQRAQSSSALMAGWR